MSSVFSLAHCAFFSDDFVLMRLRKEAVEEGPFLVRWSVVDYHCIILVVLNRSQVSFKVHSYCQDRDLSVGGKLAGFG